MRQIRLDDDIQPLSEFRSRTSFFIKQVKEDKRPLILTQHGKSIAVVLSVSDYENMREKSEMIDEIKLAESQIEQGLGITHENAIKQINRRLNK